MVHAVQEARMAARRQQEAERVEVQKWVPAHTGRWHRPLLLPSTSQRAPTVLHPVWTLPNQPPGTALA